MVNDALLAEQFERRDPMKPSRVIGHDIRREAYFIFSRDNRSPDIIWQSGGKRSFSFFFFANRRNGSRENVSRSRFVLNLLIRISFRERRSGFTHAAVRANAILPFDVVRLSARIFERNGEITSERRRIDQQQDGLPCRSRYPRLRVVPEILSHSQPRRESATDAKMRSASEWQELEGSFVVDFTSFLFDHRSCATSRLRTRRTDTRLAKSADFAKSIVSTSRWSESASTGRARASLRDGTRSPGRPEITASHFEITETPVIYVPLITRCFGAFAEADQRMSRARFAARHQPSRALRTMHGDASTSWINRINTVIVSAVTITLIGLNCAREP